MRLIMLSCLLLIASIALPQVKGAEDRKPEKKAAQDQRGTKRQPLAVEGIGPYKSQMEVREEAQYRSDQAAIVTEISKALHGLEKESVRTTILTGLLFVVAFFQALLFRKQLGLMAQTDAATKQAAEAARIGAEAAQLQSRALVAEKLPAVLWSDWKMVEYVTGTESVAADPMLPGEVPEECRPVFGYKNGGPTRIVASYYAIKWEIAVTKDGLKKEPEFGGMGHDGILLATGDKRYITTQHKIILTPGQRKSLAEDAALYVYAFVIYSDFLDEGHQIGTIAKWDPRRGFVVIEKENYSYMRHEKSYTRAFPKAKSGETVTA
jgi:hypothetical protein